MANNLYEYYKSKGQELPTVQQRTETATKAGITGYSGTADQNKTLLGYLQNTPNNGTTITTDKLNNETTIKTNPTAPAPTSTKPTIDSLLKTTQDRITEEEKAQKTASEDYAKTLGETVDRTAIYNDTGVNEKKKAVNATSKKISDENLALQDKIDAIRENPEGKSAGAIQAEINQAQIDSAKKTARWGIELTALSNDYQSAYEIATQQIQDKQDAIKADIQSKQFILQQAGTKLSTDMANAFQLKIKSIDNETALLDDALQTAKDGIKNGTINNSDGYSAMNKLMSGEMSLSQFYNSLGIDTGSDSTGSDIAGYDITSYATDPTHEQKVLSIYSAIPSISDASSADDVIKSLSPNSPITGNMVMSSAKKYNVDAGLMIALMQQDSSLGTAGLGVKTKNAGNIGNTDSGATKTFNSWEDGVDAVAKWLSQHKAQEKISYAQYGLLANTSFNPKNNTDKDAKTYLDYYIKNSAIPTSYQLGMGRASTGVNSQRYSNADLRAKELFYEATGKSLPDINVLKGLKQQVVSNNKILNNQAILADTVERNFDLAIEGEISNDVNKNATIINKILNPIYLALGDPAVNQALVSNGTISQEFANLISVRNASGTTVADKYMADELIQFGTSVEAQKAVVERLKAEAVNIQGALKDQNKELYRQIDPLQVLDENPNRVDPAEAKVMDYFSQLGMKDAGNKTLLIPRIQWTKLTNSHDDKSGLSQADALLQTLKDKGYTLLVQ